MFFFIFVQKFIISINVSQENKKNFILLKIYENNYHIKFTYFKLCKGLRIRDAFFKVNQVLHLTLIGWKNPIRSTSF